jgi:hypothetical protein
MEPFNQSKPDIYVMLFRVVFNFRVGILCAHISGVVMTRNNLLKSMAIATVFMSVLPALVYYAMYFKNIKANKNLISQRELGMFIMIALVASLSHIGVSFVQSSVAIGGALFIVSAFIHLTKIAALVLFYLACKTDESFEAQAEA